MVQDELVEQQTQGSFVSHGWDDILTTAIGKSKHLGHRHGHGGAIGFRDYFCPP